MDLEQINPGSRQCTACGREIAWDANICPYCGKDYRQPQAAPASKGSTIGAAVGIIGGILSLLGIFLPWAYGNTPGDPNLSVTGWDLYELGVEGGDNEFGIIVVLIAIGVLAMLLAMLEAVRARAPGAIVAVLGVLSMVFLLIIFSAVSAFMAGSLEEAGISMGTGLYISIVGSIAVIVGGLIGVAHKK